MAVAGGPAAQRVEAEKEWSLFCPNEAPGLADVWGDEFAVLYEKYEAQGRARRVLPARQLWFAILEAQVRPYPKFRERALLRSAIYLPHLGAGPGLCAEPCCSAPTAALA